MRYIIREYLRNSVENGDFNTVRSDEKDLQTLKSLVKKVEKNLSRVYSEVTGMKLNLPKIKVILDSNIKDGKIGGFKHPDHNNDNGILGIKPKALKNMDYLEDVIIHELIHAAIGDDLPSHKEHDGLFDRLAEKMKLPDHRRD